MKKIDMESIKVGWIARRAAFKSAAWLLTGVALFASGCSAPTALRQSAGPCGEWDAPADGIVAAFESRQRLDRCLAERLRDMDLDEAGEVRDQVWERLSRRYRPVGWKLALTGVELQKRFGVDAPLLGRLYAEMLRPDGARIRLDSGAQLAVEADLLVEIGDESINEARTLAQVAESLATVSAFIELPDLFFAREVAPNGAQLLAMNTAARFGVVGERLLAPAARRRLTRAVAGVVPARTLVEMLGGMKVSLRNESANVEIERVDLGAGVENPLHAVLRIRDAALARGERLRVGDKLSLGALGALRVAQAGQRLSVEYRFADGRALRVSTQLD